MCTYPDGAAYEGEWLLGKRHGMGTHRGAHGDEYRGGWQRDLRHGPGALRYRHRRSYWRNSAHTGDPNSGPAATPVPAKSLSLALFTSVSTSSISRAYSGACCSCCARERG